MNIRTLIAALLIPAGMSFAQTTTGYTFNLNQPIPDANAVGFSMSTNLSGISGSISAVTVNLDITGGFNGDLYATLAGPNGGFAVLLNRTGVTTGNSFGYFDSGFNITLDDSGAFNNIHFYQNDNPTLIGGELTSTWASDGENVDPLGNLVGLAGSTATLQSLNGTSPNGMWTFLCGRPVQWWYGDLEQRGLEYHDRAGTPDVDAGSGRGGCVAAGALAGKMTRQLTEET